MGNLSSCIGIRGRNREDDYKYLELRPPALIDGYETLSHMYYTHARMAILHLNNDTGHFLKHKGTYKGAGTIMCPKNASGDLDENGDRPMGFASRGRLDGAHGLVVYEIGDSGVHFVVMFRVPLLRSKWIRRGTNAFAFGFVHGHGPVGATAALYKEMEGSRRSTWFERHEFDGRSFNHAFRHRRFKISCHMGTQKRALLKVHLLEETTISGCRIRPGRRLSGGVSLAAMQAVEGRETWHSGKAIAVDDRGLAHALVVRFERDSAGRQTTLLLQPCVSPDGPGFKIMDNSFRLPDKYEERCPGVVPLPEGVRLIGQVELGRVNMSVEDVLWEADNLAINEQTYHPLRTNSLVWAKDLATLLGVGANGRELRPVGSSRNTGGNWAEMRPDGSLHYGSTAETTLTTRLLTTSL